MGAVYYVLGFTLLWGTLILLAWAYVLEPLAAALSYTLLKIVCVLRLGKWREVSWHQVPGEFLQTWWRFAAGIIPDRISGQHCTWSGVLRWQLH